MGVYYCCVKECFNNSSSKNITLFRFPKEPARSIAWARNCRRADLEKLDPDRVYSNYRVCSIHFQDEMFSSIQKNRLKINAIPTLFMWNTQFGQPQPATSHLMPAKVEFVPQNFRYIIVSSQKPQPITLSATSGSGTCNSLPNLDEALEMRTKQCLTGLQQPNIPEPEVPKTEKPDTPEPEATADPLYIGETPENFTLKCSESLGEILAENKNENYCEIVLDPPKAKVECRTCLNTVDECTSKKMSENCLLQKSFKEVIVFLVPELESKLNDDHLVCKDCLNVLEMTMKFIMKCLEVDAVLEKRTDKWTSKKKKTILKLIPEREEVRIEVDENGLESIDGEHDYCVKIILSDDEESSKLGNVPDNCSLVQELLSEDNQNKNNMEFDDLPYAPELMELSYCEKDTKSKDSNIEKPAKRKEMPFTCLICMEGFTEKDEYELHLDIHPPHICEICGKGLRKKESLRAHMFTHNDPNSFICEVCGKGFKEKCALRCHLKSHQGGKPHICDRCSKGFRTRRLLEIHIKYVHNKSYGTQCTVCGLLCRNQGTLNMHMKLVHYKEKPFECDICHRRFGRSDYLHNHKLRHMNDCQLKMRKLRRRNKLLPAIKDIGEPVPCKFCGQWYKDLMSLKHHLTMHIKRFKCQFCSLTFPQKSRLLKHEELHQGGTVEIFRCNVCWKKYKTKEALDEHVACHNNPRHFCESCGKTFNRKFLLIQHKVREHTNIPDTKDAEEIIYDSLVEVGGVPVWKCEN